MGGAASSVEAELYMQNHDNRALTTFENSPRIYKWFVDDIVSVIKRENLEQFHNHMNTLHPKIQFCSWPLGYKSSELKGLIYLRHWVYISDSHKSAGKSGKENKKLSLDRDTRRSIKCCFSKNVCRSSYQGSSDRHLIEVFIIVTWYWYTDNRVN